MQLRKTYWSIFARVLNTCWSLFAPLSRAADLYDNMSMVNSMSQDTVLAITNLFLCSCLDCYTNIVPSCFYVIWESSWVSQSCFHSPRVVCCHGRRFIKWTNIVFPWSWWFFFGSQSNLGDDKTMIGASAPYPHILGMTLPLSDLWQGCDLTPLSFGHLRSRFTCACQDIWTRNLRPRILQ